MKEEYKKRRRERHEKERKARLAAHGSQLESEVKEFFRNFRAAKDENGASLASQAEVLLEGGWDGIGYTMVWPHPGPVFARKRCVFRQMGLDAVRDFQGWFRERQEEGFVPGWRYYIKQGECPMSGDEFKGTVVHRENLHGISVLVEFIPFACVGTEQEWLEFAKRVTLLAGVDKVAREMALYCVVAAANPNALHFFSSEPSPSIERRA